jgi:recombination protein RecA
MPKEKTKEKEQTKQSKALDSAINEIKERFGEGSIMKLSETTKVNVDCIPTGSIAMDLALGVGGMPRGRIIEIYGAESSGKTTLCLHIVAEAQKKGGVCAYIDAEHAMDPEYAKRLGVNTDDLLISQPDSGENALQIVETLVKSENIDVIVVDSVAALVPKNEIDGDVGDSHVGLQARLMSQSLRRLAGMVNKSHTIVIFINQLREKIGVMFGSPEVTPGGRALKFYSSVRLDVRRIETIKKGDVAIGNRVRVKVAKNKVAPPFRVTEYDMIFGEGMSPFADILDQATNLNVLVKLGTWFSYKDIRIGQGRENVKDYLKANPEIFDEITAVVREKLLPKRVIENANAVEDLEEKSVRKERKKEIIEPVVVDA